MTCMKRDLKFITCLQRLVTYGSKVNDKYILISNKIDNEELKIPRDNDMYLISAILEEIEATGPPYICKVAKNEHVMNVIRYSIYVKA